MGSVRKVKDVEYYERMCDRLLHSSKTFEGKEGRDMKFRRKIYHNTQDVQNIWGNIMSRSFFFHFLTHLKKRKEGIWRSGGRYMITLRVYKI